jgi:outer membrane protein
MSSILNIKIFILSLALSAAFSSRALALPASPSPAPAKVGIVNTQEAIYECNEGKKEFDALMVKYAPKQAELKKLNDEIVNLKKQYDEQKGKVTSETSAAQLKTLEAKKKTLERNYTNSQNEFQKAEQEIINRIGNKLMKVLEKYAKNRGYSLVLDVANPQTSVLWADQAMSITKELIQAYNTENPVAVPATTAPAFSKDLAKPTSLRPSTFGPLTPTPKPKAP